MKIDITDGDAMEMGETSSNNDEHQAVVEPLDVDAEVIEPVLEEEGAEEPMSAQDEEDLVAQAIAAGEAAAEADASKAAQEKAAAKEADVEDNSLTEKEVEELQKKLTESNESYLRLQAEWENYRKRTARERSSERGRATEKLVSNLLPVMDDLERALDHAKTTNPEGEFASFITGVDAVRAKLSDVFSKENVETIDPAGEPFDALEHQAVGRVDDPDVYDETVRDVYQKGYRAGDKVLRPAMVTITTGGEKRPAESNEEAK